MLKQWESTVRSTVEDNLKLYILRKIPILQTAVVTIVPPTTVNTTNAGSGQITRSGTVQVSDQDLSASARHSKPNGASSTGNSGSAAIVNNGPAGSKYMGISENILGIHGFVYFTAIFP